MPLIPLEEAHRIACRFDLPGSFKVFDFPGKGNINRQTYLIAAEQPGDDREYLLQMLNTEVFTRPDAVMQTMISCIQAQQKALSKEARQEDEAWEPIRLIPTKKGALYLITDDTERPQYWRLMVRIRHARSYKCLSEVPNPGMRLGIAEETGRGLALFGALTSGMNTAGITDPLPGYRNTALYYDQLDSILRGSRTIEEASAFLPSNPILRQENGHLFIVHLNPRDYRNRKEDRQARRLVALAQDHRFYCLELQRQLASGNLKKTIVHGDTKLDNFLFSTRTGKVRALVDLDTVMLHTWLSDWGDMARSLVNVSGEKLRNADEIEPDMEVFKALARGFIGSASHLPGHEIDLMADAARIMAMELGVRFLADYLRGDTYFRLSAPDPEDLNLSRAAVQFSVFQSLGRCAPEAKQYIAGLYSSPSDLF
jgi:hypothetical protein